MQVAKFNLEYAILGHPLITSENIELNLGIWYRPDELYNVLCKLPTNKGYACFYHGDKKHPVHVRATETNLFLDIRNKWIHPDGKEVVYEIIEDNQEKAKQVFDRYFKLDTHE